MKLPFQYPVLLALLSLSLVGQAQATRFGGAAPDALLNLGLPIHKQFGEGSLRVFVVLERDQGHTDINGDGDTEDPIYYVYDAGRSLLLDTGYAAPHYPIPPGGDVIGDPTYFHAAGRHVTMSVSESRSGNQDLNGDGDTEDLVLMIYSSHTGTVTNSRLAAGPLQLRRTLLDDHLLYISISEEDQGGLDLDGNGLLGPAVAAYDLRTGSVQNWLGVGNVSFGVDASETELGFFVPETPGVDLNRDGDSEDAVFHVYDERTETLINSGLANFFFFASAIYANGAWQVCVAEDGTDLNGDGDVFDAFVVHSYYSETGRVVPHRLSGFGGLAGANFWALPVRELDNGRDLNGDGDLGDRVTYLQRGVDGAFENVGLALERISFLPNDYLRQAGEWLVQNISERDQGDTDLNMDGDANDAILHATDLRTGVTLNLGIETPSFTTVGSKLYFVQVENIVGMDINGDGDTRDQFLSYWDSRTQSITITDTHAVGVGDVSGSSMLITQFEFILDEDLTGDGDKADFVNGVYDLETEKVHSLRIEGIAQLATPSTAVIVTLEWVDQTDHNADGDQSDRVIFIARVPR